VNRFLTILAAGTAVMTGSVSLHAFETLKVPAEGAYTGAYCDFGDGEDHVTLEALEKFQELTGKPLSIVGMGSFWARQSFPTEQVSIDPVLRRRAADLLVSLDAPFDQNRGPDRFSLTEILAGKWDAYIDRWADEAAKVPAQFFVSFACEMNGTWFPWSGWYYGKGPRDPKPVNKPQDKKQARQLKAAGLIEEHADVNWFGPGDFKDPSTWQGPETFKKAWRYVVDRVRARGATNISGSSSQTTTPIPRAS